MAEKSILLKNLIIVSLLFSVAIFHTTPIGQKRESPHKILQIRENALLLRDNPLLMSSETKHTKLSHSGDHTGLIIHLFALAHALIAIIARLFDYYDDIPLTVLTISMIIIIAAQKKFPIELTAIVILIVTFLGYLTGLYFGEFLFEVIGSRMFSSAIATFLITEIFGWTTCLLSYYNKTIWERSSERWLFGTRQIIMAAVAILFFRITYSLIFRSPYFALNGGIYTQFNQLFSNTYALMVLICSTAIFIVLPNKSAKPRKRTKHGFSPRALAVTLFNTLLPVLLALIVYYKFPLIGSSGKILFDWKAFVGLYAVSLLATITTYAAFALMRYVSATHTAFRDEQEKRHKEQYKYTRLKQQINPHFLFNSLNILDFLVQSGENERASSYIRKLAGLYRYMLKNENEHIVSLGEEMEFTEMYIDLLKERFPEGLIVENRVSPDDYLRHVVPCGVQMLLENATKHNAVSTSSPLRVEIYVEDDMLVVTNNIQPRISRQPSTRLGLANISKQYEDIANRKVEIINDERNFTVKLPLL